MSLYVTIFVKYHYNDRNEDESLGSFRGIFHAKKKEATTFGVTKANVSQMPPDTSFKGDRVKRSAFDAFRQGQRISFVNIC